MPAISHGEVEQVLSQASTIDLALVDISGFDLSIWARCQTLRDRDIPFSVISPRHQSAIQQANISSGALGLLGKPPLVLQKFLQLIQDLLKGRNESNFVTARTS